MPLSNSQLAALPTPLAGRLRAISAELEVASAAAARLDRVLSALPPDLSDEFWFQVQVRISNLAADPDYLRTALGDPPLLSALLGIYIAALQNTLDELLINPHFVLHLTESRSQSAPRSAPGAPSSQA